MISLPFWHSRQRLLLHGLPSRRIRPKVSVLFPTFSQRGLSSTAAKVLEMSSLRRKTLSSRCLFSLKRTVNSVLFVMARFLNRGFQCNWEQNFNFQMKSFQKSKSRAGNLEKEHTAQWEHEHMNSSVLYCYVIGCVSSYPLNGLPCLLLILSHKWPILRNRGAKVSVPRDFLSCTFPSA